MNRIIKFRVWIDCSERGKMIYPKWIKFNDTNSVETDKYLGGFPQQFTGLLDKNGKEIYEGDIISWNDPDFFDGNFVGRDFIEEVTFEGGAFYPVCNWTCEEIEPEIIGNIFENPELIKKEKSANDSSVEIS